MVSQANLEGTREGAATNPRGACNSRMTSRDSPKWIRLRRLVEKPDYVVGVGGLSCCENDLNKFFPRPVVVTKTSICTKLYVYRQRNSPPALEVRSRNI